MQSYFNERQKIELNIKKTDDETGIGLEGAVYGLYAKQDVINADGAVILKADSLIEKSISDVNGELEFNADLPLGDYYVKEIQAPIGYASSNEVFEVPAVYKGQDISTITFSKTFKNAITKVEVSKKDITNDEEIAGAFLTVYPKDDEGAIYASWVSGQDGVNEDGTIKEDKTAQMIELVHSYHKEAVFHRAFDVCPDAYEAIETLIRLGADRILTSGQKAKAFEGKDLLKDLQEKYGDKIEFDS